MLTGTEVNQLAILQTWPRIWIRDNWEQIKPAVRVGLQLGAFEIQVRGSNSSEWENYTLVSNRYVSQGLYQNLLTKINFENLFKNHNCNPLKADWWHSGCWNVSKFGHTPPLSDPWDHVALFNWRNCTLSSPSMGIKVEVSQSDNLW